MRLPAPYESWTKTLGLNKAKAVSVMESLEMVNPLAYFLWCELGKAGEKSVEKIRLLY